MSPLLGLTKLTCLYLSLIFWEKEFYCYWCIYHYCYYCYYYTGNNVNYSNINKTIFCKYARNGVNRCGQAGLLIDSLVTKTLWNHSCVEYKNTFRCVSENHFQSLEVKKIEEWNNKLADWWIRILIITPIMIIIFENELYFELYQKSKSLDLSLYLRIQTLLGLVLYAHTRQNTTFFSSVCLK